MHCRVLARNTRYWGKLLEIQAEIWTGHLLKGDSQASTNTLSTSLHVHVTVHRNKFLFNKTNRTHEFLIFYFVKKILHVSDISFAHHQEFSTVHSTLVSFMQVLWPFPIRVRMELLCSSILTLIGRCHHTCKKYTNVECTVENSWWWAKEMPETCRVFCQNKIWEIRESCWFY